MIVKIKMCSHTSSPLQEEWSKIINKRNLQIHLYSRKEVTRLKIDCHFNLIFLNNKNLIKERKSLLKLKMSRRKNLHVYSYCLISIKILIR
jgi:hypothetical protein